MFGFFIVFSGLRLAPARHNRGEGGEDEQGGKAEADKAHAFVRVKVGMVHGSSLPLSIFAGLANLRSHRGAFLVACDLLAVGSAFLSGGEL